MTREIDAEYVVSMILLAEELSETFDYIFETLSRDSASGSVQTCMIQFMEVVMNAIHDKKHTCTHTDEAKH